MLSPKQGQGPTMSVCKHIQVPTTWEIQLHTHTHTHTSVNQYICSNPIYKSLVCVSVYLREREKALVGRKDG